MAKASSIVCPLPGVGLTVGYAVLRSTDPQRRVWNASVSINLEHQGLDEMDFELGEYRSGLTASVWFEKGWRNHLIWDMLSIALYSDEQADMRAFMELAHPGSVQKVLDAIAIEEETIYGKGMTASTDRNGLYQERVEYGVSLWDWS